MAGGGGALFLQVVGGVAWLAHSDMIERLTVPTRFSSGDSGISSAPSLNASSG